MGNGHCNTKLIYEVLEHRTALSRDDVRAFISQSLLPAINSAGPDAQNFLKALGAIASLAGQTGRVKDLEAVRALRSHHISLTCGINGRRIKLFRSYSHV